MKLVLLWTAAGADFAAPRELEEATVEVGLKCAGEQTEHFTCNEAPCPVEKTCYPEDATWTEWTEWTACDCNEYQERHRHQATFAKCGGKQLEGPMLEGQPCTCDCICDPEPIHCALSDWGEWNACSAMKSSHCGKGMQKRNRAVQTPVGHCGVSCGAESADAMDEVRECDLGPCEDSTVENPELCNGPWGEWGTCNDSCQQARTRELAADASGLDIASKCGEQEEVRPCEDYFGNVEECKPLAEGQDCKFRDWGLWGACTKSCGGGHQMRQRELIQRKKAGGQACEDEIPVVELQACEEEPCVAEPTIVNAVWNDWGAWSECTVTCGPGMKHHTRTHTEPQNGGVYPNGDTTEYVACEVQPCDEDFCEFSEWGEWGACSSGTPGDTNGVDMPGNWGVRYRDRRITKYPQVDSYDVNLACRGPIRQAEPCGGKCNENPDADGCRPPVGSLSDWSEWTTCSATCNGGSQKRAREVTVAGEFAAAEEHLVEVQACNMDCCDGACGNDRDCIWGDWNTWGACTATCGGGEHQRYRMVVQHAKNKGKPCEIKDSYVVEACATQSCEAAKFCVWSDWGATSACTQTCGGGVQHRARTLTATELEPADSAYLSSTSKVELLEEIAALRAGMDRTTVHMYGLLAAVLGGVGLVVLRRRAPPVSTTE